ncbi:MULTISPECIES: acyl-CoA thioesterase [Acinetobacter]|uniref:acyl-CoA thioesterase n=1 Tax=Acinetobacter TaxID=469 RepID=UPI002003638D|nr:MULTISPECIES: thioesterase family protein [Acinetobacter]MCK4103061.1 thioesterase family protein [Acinetobacter radioresistens]
MSLKQLFQAVTVSEEIDIPAGWLQGRTIYGGLVAGILMHKAVATVNDLQKRLLSTSVTFVGPVQESRARITAEVLREGKSVTTVEVRLWQNDEVQSILLASFGAERPSAIEVHQERHAPDYPLPEQLNCLPYREGFLPPCYQQFELCWAEGQLPCSGSKTPDFGGWFRFKPEFHDNSELELAHLLTLMDIWPPAVIPLFKQVAPASSLTWHITLVHPVQHELHDWFKYKAFTDFAGDGYSTEYAHIWDAQNRLIAISRQTVTVFA